MITTISLVTIRHHTVTIFFLFFPERKYNEHDTCLKKNRFYGAVGGEWCWVVMEQWFLEINCVGEEEKSRYICALCLHWSTRSECGGVVCALLSAHCGWPGWWKTLFYLSSRTCCNCPQNYWHLGFTHPWTPGLLVFKEQDPRCFSLMVRSYVARSPNGPVHDHRQAPLLRLCV